MPLITIKVFENELSSEQSKDLVNKVTDSVADVTSDKLRDVTWVIGVLVVMRSDLMTCERSWMQTRKFQAWTNCVGPSPIL